MSEARGSANSGVIVRNSVWYGLETSIAFVSGIATSIFIARALGPIILGHYTYIAWLINITASLGSLGIPAATNKYMGEFLGRGEGAVARTIFFATLRLQTYIAFGLTASGIVLLLLTVERDFRVCAVLLALSVLPAMITWIPTQANAAREDLGANVPGALVANLIWIVGVTLTLVMGWGVNGLAASLLSMRTGELFCRLFPTLRWVRRYEQGKLPPDLKRRFMAFSGQSVVLLGLSIIVWDRSEVVFLKYFSDIRQLAFYTVAFNITERLRSIPLTFSSATSATMMAQFGRNPAGLDSLFRASIRYVALISAPVYVGLACVAGPVMRLSYGARYMDAVPLMALASVLAIPRAVLSPVNALLAALDDQKMSVRWNCVMAVLNLSLDFALIPVFGGMGAVIANGAAQTVSAAGLALLVSRKTRIHFPVADLLRIGLATVLMAGAVRLVSFTSNPGLNLIASVGTGGIAFLIGIRYTKALTSEDAARLSHISKRVPTVARPAVERVIGFIAPAPLQPELQP